MATKPTGNPARRPTNAEQKAKALAAAKDAPPVVNSYLLRESERQGRTIISWSQEVEDEILERLANGETLTRICRDAHMPIRGVAWAWQETVPGFADRMLRARRGFAFAKADEIEDIADDGSNDWMEKTFRDETVTVFNHEHVQRSKLRIETRRWLIERIASTDFGPPSGAKGEGDEGGDGQTRTVVIKGGLPTEPRGSTSGT